MSPRHRSSLALAFSGALSCFVSPNAGAEPPGPIDEPGAASEAPGPEDGGWDIPPEPEAPEVPEAEPPPPPQADVEGPRPEAHPGDPVPTTPLRSLDPPAEPPDDPYAPYTARRGQLGITVGVPFYDDSIIHGDMTVDIRYGRKFWWLVPSISGGFRQARLDPARVPDHARRKKLEAWHTTVGLRLEIPTSPRVFPFVGISGEISTWSFTADTTDFCQDAFYPDAWRCYQRQDWKTGWAVKPQVGFVFKPEPSLALEFWVERGTVFAPDTFTRRVNFINPALGFTWQH